MRAALLGGLFIGVLSALPFVNVANCCCLWIVTGGMLAAYIAQQDDPRPLGLVAGARLGFRAGAIGACVWLVASVGLAPLVAPLQRSAEIMMRSAADIPPDVRDLLDRLGDGASATVQLAVGFLLQLFIAPLFSALGGLIGAAVFGPDAPAHSES